MPSLDMQTQIVAGLGSGCCDQDSGDWSMHSLILVSHDEEPPNSGYNGSE